MPLFPPFPLSDYLTILQSLLSLGAQTSELRQPNETPYEPLVPNQPDQRTIPTQSPISLESPQLHAYCGLFASRFTHWPFIVFSPLTQLPSSLHTTVTPSGADSLISPLDVTSALKQRLDKPNPRERRYDSVLSLLYCVSRGCRAKEAAESVRWRSGEKEESLSVRKHLQESSCGEVGQA